MSRTCDCCSNPAEVHETTVSNGVKTEVHLCAAHARERGYPVPPQSPHTVLMGKLIVTHKGATAKPVLTCDTCGTTMNSVRESGLVGCPECYRVFETELGAVISRAQAGACVHVGRHPARSADVVDRAAMCEKLARELREAIAREEYMRAAKIRDRMLALGSPPQRPAADAGSAGGV